MNDIQKVDIIIRKKQITLKILFFSDVIENFNAIKWSRKIKTTFSPGFIYATRVIKTNGYYFPINAVHNFELRRDLLCFSDIHTIYL